MNDRKNLQRLLFGVTALADLGRKVTAGRDFPKTMRAALHVICGMFSVPRAALYTYDRRTRSLLYLTGKGYSFLTTKPLAVSQRQMRALPANEDVPLAALARSPFCRRNADVLGRIEAQTVLPLFAQKDFVGVIVLGRRLALRAYLPSERELLKAAANQCAIALHNARLFARLARQAAENRRLYEDMRRIYHDTIQAFATAIDAKDQYTKHHSYRVARYAAMIARSLGWRGRDVEAIYVAGLLHDIGKLSLDVDLINKGNDLTAEDREKIRRHAEVSYDIVARIRLPWQEVAGFIRHHHERPDGRGYPDSLPGENLSDGAKILALADAYDAMTTDRPYRLKLTPGEAVREIRRCEGTQFDGRLASVLFRIIEEEREGKETLSAPLRPADDGAFLPLMIEVPWKADA